MAASANTAAAETHPPRSPQGLRPEIARIVEELARAAVRREDRQARERAETQMPHNPSDDE